jgi:two-component system chemotaxis sensor kinase CheA
MMMARYSETFRDEAQELLTELESALIELEEEPKCGEAIDRVFRVLHTLKGSGAMAGFDHTAALAHELENLFDLIRSGRLEVSRELINLSLMARDLLRDCIEREGSGVAVESTAIHLLLEMLRDQYHAPPEETQTPAETALQRENDETQLFLVRFRPGNDLFLRGLSPDFFFSSLAALGSMTLALKTPWIPLLEQMNPERCYLAWDLLIKSAASIDALHDVFIFVEDDSEIEIRVISSPTSTDVDVLRPFLESHGHLATDALTARLAEIALTPTPPLIERPEAKSPLAEEPLPLRLRNEQVASIRVRSERLDNLVNMIGEMVTIQARLSETIAGRKDPFLETLAEEVERLTWGLRDEVLFIRMLPVSATFNRLKRLVRDVSALLGKEVELVTNGDETELDKTVIERLQDPLMHLVRNAIDHGIEAPEERQAQGKPLQGRIQISAVHNGPNVVLTISDDGAGLHRDKLLRRALKVGLIENERSLSEREVQQLIFAPGFSTATEVTSVSGRGVGMDVVRRAIDNLRGSIEVNSTAGFGTSFAITLPLTLAIIDGLLVSVGGEQFVIPLSAVEECVELSRQDGARANGRQYLQLRGAIVPYLRLREHFSCAGPTPRREQVVVIHNAGERVGLVVDRVIGSHQTVIKSMGRMLQATPGFSGATILGSGRVALILDVAQLVAAYAATELGLTGT